MQHESFYEWSVLVGPWRKWWPNGQLKEEAFYEGGKRLREKKWDEAGVLQKE